MTDWINETINVACLFLIFLGGYAVVEQAISVLEFGGIIGFSILMYVLTVFNRYK